MLLSLTIIDISGVTEALSETTEKVGKRILRARIDWDCRVAGAPRNDTRKLSLRA